MTQAKYAPCNPHDWEHIVPHGPVHNVYACRECWAYRLLVPVALDGEVTEKQVREVVVEWPNGTLKTSQRDILPDNEPEMNGSAPVSEP